MLAVIGWGLGALLALAVLLLVCPIRYRSEAGAGGGFLDIILLFGLYRKHVAWHGDRESPKESTKEPKREGSHGLLEPEADPSSSVDQEKSKTNGETAAGPSSQAARDGAAPEKQGREPADGTKPDRSAESADAPAEPGEGEKRPSAASVLLYAWHNGTIHLALTLCRSVIAHAKPSVFLITGRAGLGDPMETGIAAGLTWAALPGAARIDWDYTESLCQLTLKLQGRIIPLYLLWLGGRFLAAKPVRETVRYRKLEIRN